MAVDGSGHLFIGDFGDCLHPRSRPATGTYHHGRRQRQRRLLRRRRTGHRRRALDLPEGIALDAGGDLFIADQGNARVREVDASTGVITTVAGNGHRGYSGDGGQATAAMISYPRSRGRRRPAENLFISDTNNARIREVNLASG